MLIISVNLKGQVSGMISNQGKYQSNTVTLNKGKKLTKSIEHADREPQKCTQAIHISDEVLKAWGKSDCPNWEKPSRWKGMNTNERIKSHALSFDEGFGVNLEFTN